MALLSHSYFSLHSRAFASQGGLLSGSSILMKNPLCHCLIDLFHGKTNGIVLIVRILIDGEVGLFYGRLQSGIVILIAHRSNGGNLHTLFSQI